MDRYTIWIIICTNNYLIGLLTLEPYYLKYGGSHKYASKHENNTVKYGEKYGYMLEAVIFTYFEDNRISTVKKGIVDRSGGCQHLNHRIFMVTV